jgi:phosphoglycerate kinase
MNGPLGVFEVEPFDEGTRGLVKILETLTDEGTVTVVGGGDSVAALEAFGKVTSVSYVSTGGGATLELLAGDILPGVAAIEDIGSTCCCTGGSTCSCTAGSNCGCTCGTLTH